jgi:translation initiation factor 1A
MLGNGRLEALCIADGKLRQCHIRGKMRKKVWVAAGDIVLVALREYQDDKADVVAKYAPDEARELKKRGELPDGIKINEAVIAPAPGEDGAGAGGVEGDYEFDAGSESDSDVDVDAI